jgi:hypothetical protein
METPVSLSQNNFLQDEDSTSYSLNALRALSIRDRYSGTLCLIDSKSERNPFSCGFM